MVDLILFLDFIAPSKLRILADLPVIFLREPRITPVDHALGVVPPLGGVSEHRPVGDGVEVLFARRRAAVGVVYWGAHSSVCLFIGLQN